MNKKFLENNYVVIPNFINSYRANELSEEYKEYCLENNLSGDDQSPNSHSCYNYISFLELLCEKTQEVSSILEETVLPTYVYSRVYLNGSVLERHTDRDACEISLTVHLSGDKPWPIYIKTPSGEEKKIILNSGDALMYRGREAEHWRENFEGQYYTQIFLHYVRSRGECAYAYFDKKKEIDKENKDETKVKNNNKSSYKIGMNEDENIDFNQDTKPTTPTLIVKGSRSRLEDYIHIFDDVISESDCKLILDEYVNSDDWSGTYVGAEAVLDKSIRNCDQIALSNHCVIDKNYDIRTKIDQILFDSHAKGIEKYREYHPLFVNDIDTGYQLLRYKEGQFYVQHTDSFKEQQRSLSCSIQLNDDYDGGEFAFFDREIMIRGKTGSIIMFPSNFMYPHEIMPVLRGTRYATISWLV